MVLLTLTRAKAMAKRRAAGGQHDRLVSSFAISAELTALGQAVLENAVEDARRDGRSWQEIGARLGVSRQAAQQRFGAALVGATIGEIARSDVGRRLTKRVMRVLEDADRLARGAGAIRAEHVLIALTRERGGLAATLLAAAGITSDQARRLVGPQRGGGRAAFGPSLLAVDAAAVLRLALGEMSALGHRFLGTEHLLLGILLEGEAPAFRMLAESGASLETIRADLSVALVELGVRGSRRGRAKRSGA